VVNDELELATPQVRAPLLDGLNGRQQLDLSDGVVAFGGDKLAAVVGDDALVAVVVQLTKHAAQAFGVSSVGLHDERAVIPRRSEDRLSGDGRDQGLDSGLARF
jgi:hypothetical protein